MDSNTDLLHAAYKELDFAGGDLVPVTNIPPAPDSSDEVIEEWLNKGEWLTIAAEVGAERVFFVDGNPVVVFAQHTGQDATGEELRQLFNRIWCMARPRLLFLSCPGEIAVYDLGRQPVAHDQDINEKRLLAVARSLAEVSEQLARFSREQIETGLLFNSRDLTASTNRADESLIRQLKIVRQRLINNGQFPALEVQHAHSLIGRSIFIRYLEDREILLPEDFRDIASQRQEWMQLLDTPWDKPPIEPEMENRLFLKVLHDKEFTYALFQYLEDNFNGDIFPSTPGEQEAVTSEHLELLRRFLCGEGDDQESLFFWAYDFRIVPIELISSIYEEFYHVETKAKPNKGNKNNHTMGSHYTPAALVEWVLSQTLTLDVLKKNPRVLDPAAGSGIFLVEAFQRILRYRTIRAGSLLSREALLDILKNQIAGIEINPQAARVAAFSLYLAFLHSQQPPAIRMNRRLPYLLHQDERPKDELDFDILLTGNAFDVEAATFDVEVRHRFLSNCADVVIGNPPWGDSGKEEKKRARVASDWCQKRSLPVGDGEPSQQFIHRALDLLQDGGKCGLLVSTGILFKQNATSHRFRRHWLTRAKLHQVTNFVHVRHLFFSGAVAPFASVIWTKDQSPEDILVGYWSAKKTAFIRKNKVVVLSRSDFKTVPQSELMADDKLWKVYWWGSHRDAALLSALRLNAPLESHPFLDVKSSEGFKEGGGKPQTPEWWPGMQELPVTEFYSYGSILLNKLIDAPQAVASPRKERHSDGRRLLIKGAPAKKEIKFREILARLEDERFAVRHSIYSFPVKNDPDSLQNAKTALGILWSSLARYYFFLSDSRFGIWYEQILLKEFRGFPIPLPSNNTKSLEMQRRLMSIVDQLNQSHDEDLFFSPEAQSQRQRLEAELDEAVFDLYNLNKAERDLVRDLCEVGLDLFYNGDKGQALKPVPISVNLPSAGFVNDVGETGNARDLTDYLHAFTSYWNAQLSADAEMGWQILSSNRIFGLNHPAMLGVRFGACYPENKEGWRRAPLKEWHSVLNNLGQSNLNPYGSQRIYAEGLARVVSGADILIIKRNERRLWTPSAAREDAEATVVQTWQQQEMAMRSNNVALTS